MPTFRYLIATTMVPTNPKFIEDFHKLCKECNCTLLAMKGMESSKKCYNLAFKIESDTEQQAERIAEVVTIAMGPISRYCHCNNDFDGFELLYADQIKSGRRVF